MQYVQCMKCHHTGPGFEVEILPGKFARFCSQACLLEWEIPRFRLLQNEPPSSPRRSTP